MVIANAQTKSDRVAELLEHNKRGRSRQLGNIEAVDYVSNAETRLLVDRRLERHRTKLRTPAHA